MWNTNEMRSQLHYRSSRRDPVLKDLLDRDGNRSSLHDTNSLLWFESYSLNNPSAVQKTLTGFVALH